MAINTQSSPIFRSTTSSGLPYAIIPLATSYLTNARTFTGSFFVTIATLTYIIHQLGHDTVQSPFSLLGPILFADVMWILFFSSHGIHYTAIFATLTFQLFMLVCLSVCLRKFSRSFSPVELVLSAQLAFMLLHNFLHSSTVINKIWCYFMSPSYDQCLSDNVRLVSDVDAFTMVLAAGLVLRVLGQSLPLVTSSNQVFYVYHVTFTVFQYLVIWAEISKEPITWLFSYIVKDRVKIVLLLYWLLCCIVTIAVIYRQNVTNHQASTIERKLFHGVSLAVYVPGLMMSPDLLHMSSWIAMTVFACIESIRVCQLDQLSHHLNRYLSIFLDKKDAGPLALTPVYLLLAVSYPLWASHLIYPTREG